MDLRHLHHFDTLAEAGSLHRAARRLGLRQPALSQSIRALEADVGVRLVERGPRGSCLTRAGSAFLGEIRGILAALEQAAQVARLTAEAAAPLRLGIADDIATPRLATVLQAFRQSFPDAPVIVGDGPATRLRSLLDSGLLDLVLLPDEAMMNQAGTASLWPVEVHLAMPLSHPFADEAFIDIHQLKVVPLVFGTGDHLSAPDRLLKEACRTAGIEPMVAAMVCRPEVRLLLVAAGFGLTVLPALDPALTITVGIESRPLQPPLHLTVTAAWPVSGPTPEARRFLGLARHTEAAALTP